MPISMLITYISLQADYQTERVTMSKSAHRIMMVLRRYGIFAATLFITVGFALIRRLPYSSGAVPVLYNSNIVWNQPIGASPALDANSTQKIQLLASTINGAINIDGINGAWSVPVYAADRTPPLQQVCDANGYAPCENVPIPAGLLRSPDGDAKTVIVDNSSNPLHAWSFWQLTHGSTGWTVGRGAFGYGVNTTLGDGLHNYSGGAWGGRVAGWNYFAGLIRPQEISQGHIDHALEFNIPAQVAASTPVWPAQASHSQSTRPY